jgi:hypothetical protein
MSNPTKNKSKPRVCEQYLLTITTPTFEGKLVIEDESVVSQEPILRWMQYWTFFDIQLYCQRRGWEMKLTRVDS